MVKSNENIKIFISGILNSYSQIFFSDRLLFSIILLLVTFFDIYTGLTGIVGIVAANAFAWSLGYDKLKIGAGFYGFNVLLVCLGIGTFFVPCWQLWMLVVLCAIFTLFVTILLEGWLGKYGLPYLSLPFLIAIWVITLASREFSTIGISQRGIYSLNELYSVGGIQLVKIFLWWNELPVVASLKTYLISLGAIFFQYNMLSGLFIAIGMLLYSRIAFTLSLIGFYSAYLFYLALGANINEVSYSYIGFNYILSAVAIGGFFLIPSTGSYIWAALLTPIVAILTISLNYIFFIYQLAIYSLPFNIIVILFIYVLKLRIKITQGLKLVMVQENMPEKNLYSYRNQVARFKNTKIITFNLPFFGEWTVSQGHDGEITHKADWKHAWDFVIEDESKKTYSGTGRNPEDYYCYQKPVLSPADGIIEEIFDDIADNNIGDVNLDNNWGNTIIIAHGASLYSSLNHLKAGSFKVKKGEHIKKGQVIAQTGNSGHSPEPHLHFQFQVTPYIGSKTIDYPFGYYIQNENKKYKFHSFSNPYKGELVCNISANILISSAFRFIPGQTLTFEIKNKNNVEQVSWEVHADIYNQTYLYCKKSHSIAYFFNDCGLHIFKYFKGKRNSLLYFFFLAAYKIQPGFYKNMTLSDIYPENLIFSKPLLFFNDFIAPFFSFLSYKYTFTYHNIDDDLNYSNIILKSSAESYIF
ncbi:MAG: urea transporter, partial [Bacteroidia bacterium]|nr:urea transporter [Bacteroidia bacterium]